MKRGRQLQADATTISTCKSNARGWLASSWTSPRMANATSRAEVQSIRTVRTLPIKNGLTLRHKDQHPPKRDALFNHINCIFAASVTMLYRNQLLDGELAIEENRSTEHRASPRPRARYRRHVGVDHHRSRCRWSYSGNLVSHVEGDVANLIVGSASTPT